MARRDEFCSVLWTRPGSTRKAPRYAIRLLPWLAASLGPALFFLALLTRGPDPPEAPAIPAGAVGRVEPAPLEIPPSPPTPGFIERRRIAAIARGEEDAEERARRSLKRARGRQEGIERMFARDLEEWQKRALLDFSAEPVDRAASLSASLSPSDRARIFEELEIVAFDQFRKARRLRDLRPERHEVFESLMRDAREARAEAERVVSKFVRPYSERG